MYIITLLSGSFLVQFLILVFLIGIPWCFMETALGQYSGRGPPAIGDMVPIGKGNLILSQSSITFFMIPDYVIVIKFARLHFNLGT